MLKDYYQKHSKKTSWINARTRTLPTEFWFSLFNILNSFDFQIHFVLDLSPISLCTAFDATTRSWNSTSDFIRCITILREEDDEWKDILFSSYLCSLKKVIQKQYTFIYKTLRDDFNWMNYYRDTETDDPKLSLFYTSILNSVPFMVDIPMWDKKKKVVSQKKRKAESPPKTPKKKRKLKSSEDKNLSKSKRTVRK
jgi:hypothetical protein